MEPGCRQRSTSGPAPLLFVHTPNGQRSLHCLNHSQLLMPRRWLDARHVRDYELTISSDGRCERSGHAYCCCILDQLIRDCELDRRNTLWTKARPEPSSEIAKKKLPLPSTAMPVAFVTLASVTVPPACAACAPAVSCIPISIKNGKGADKTAE